MDIYIVNIKQDFRGNGKKSMEKQTHFDVIVIGSGMGALTTASILARLKNKKVLVLEKHFKLGGFTHTFKREGKFLWDVGIHYVGDMGKGEMLRKLFDIVTEGNVDWMQMTDPFERFVYPEITFDQYSNCYRELFFRCKNFFCLGYS